MSRERPRSFDPLEIFGPRPPMLVEDRGGFLLWDPEDVALIRSECHGRVEVTRADGGVAHAPGPASRFEGGPWVSIADGVWAHPAHARRVGGFLVFPGAWRVKSAVRLPKPRMRVEAEDERLPGTDLHLGEVLWVEGAGPRRATWHTDRGAVPFRNIAAVAAHLHAALVRAGLGRYVNLRRVRAVRRDYPRYLLELDGGHVLPVYRNSTTQLKKALRVPNLQHLEPRTEAAAVLYAKGLRDWPCDLLSASKVELVAWFGDDTRRLIANVIWQVYRMGIRGCGTDHRAFWYLRLGVILRRLVPNTEPLYLQFQQVLGEMIGEARLFTYRDFGFEETRPELRSVGHLLPHVVLVAEKKPLRRNVEAARRRYGTSSIVLGGQPTYFATEFLAEALRAAGVRCPLIVIAYVDYDPFGWGAATGIKRQLERYGMRVEGVRMPVTPARFTPEERRKLSLPLPSTNAAIRGQVREWMKRTHGVDGRRRGLTADSLSLERMLRALEEELP